MAHSVSRGWGGAGWVKGLMLRGGGGFGKAGTEVPLPPRGGQGQVMHAREHVGPQGMACVLRSPGGSRQLGCNPKPE